MSITIRIVSWCTAAKEKWVFLNGGETHRNNPGRRTSLKIPSHAAGLAWVQKRTSLKIKINRRRCGTQLPVFMNRRGLAELTGCVQQKSPSGRAQGCSSGEALQSYSSVRVTSIGGMAQAKQKMIDESARSWSAGSLSLSETFAWPTRKSERKDIDRVGRLACNLES